MTRYTIVDRTSAARNGVASSRLLFGMDTDEADAIDAWSERVADAQITPGVARRRIALVCRSEVIREWDSQNANSPRSPAGR